MKWCERPEQASVQTLSAAFTLRGDGQADLRRRVFREEADSRDERGDWEQRWGSLG